MKPFRIVVVFLMLLASSVALAATDVAPVAKAPVKADAIKPAAVPAKADARSAAGPVKVAGGSQQNRMRECNKSATGKKGAERKAFMKTCLSTKKG